MTLTIRPAEATDADDLWSILAPVFAAGDTYAIDPEISKKDAVAYWTGASNGTFVAEYDTRVLGTYYLKRNQSGGGAHVCNCGYVTHPDARGKGIARAMLDHSLETARAAGFRAMQYNFVVATNTRAVAIWQQAGFEIVGRLPGAFKHPSKGFVDALVMHKTL